LENKRVEQVLLEAEGGAGGDSGGAQTTYTHVSKCKNSKIKETPRHSSYIYMAVIVK
jgi:hypothetical protein